MLLILALACTQASIDLGGTPAGTLDTTKQGNTGTGTNPGTGTDTQTDVTGTETVTDTVTDTTTTDPTDAGDYTGTLVAGLTGTGWADFECTGDVSFSIDDSGVLLGDASCDTGSWLGVIEGALTGTDAEGTLAGAWSINLGMGPYDLPFTGEAADGVAVLSLDSDLGWAQVYGDGEAERN